ncbi:hypothetical protein T06_11267 [Trichinella sp. T6]|nr:hypothetical protein T06_11267 [Trichinella sp. T6]
MIIARVNSDGQSADFKSVVVIAIVGCRIPFFLWYLTFRHSNRVSLVCTNVILSVIDLFIQEDLQLFLQILREINKQQI